jgi:hypothetical protein
MSYGSGNVITAADYNMLAGLLNAIYGDVNNGAISFSTASFGYGQHNVLPVITGDTITAEQWTALFQVLYACTTHQGITPGIVPTSAVIGNIITAYNGLQGLLGIINGSNNIGGGTNANNVTTNALQVVNGQYTLTTGGIRVTNSRHNTKPWHSKVYCEIMALFPDYDSARYFFNAGGQVKFTFSSVNNGSGPNAEENTLWANLLANIGTITFGNISVPGTPKVSTNQVPGTAMSPAPSFVVSPVGFYDLTNVYQEIFSASVTDTPFVISGHSCTTTASVHIKARSNVGFGSTGMFRFLVEFDNVSIDTVTNALTALEIDSTLTLLLDDRTSSGAINILSPTYSVLVNFDDIIEPSIPTPSSSNGEPFGISLTSTNEYNGAYGGPGTVNPLWDNSLRVIKPPAIDSTKYWKIQYQSGGPTGQNNAPFNPYAVQNITRVVSSTYYWEQFYLSVNYHSDDGSLTPLDSALLASTFAGSSIRPVWLETADGTAGRFAYIGITQNGFQGDPLITIVSSNNLAQLPLLPTMYQEQWTSHVYSKMYLVKPGTNAGTIQATVGHPSVYNMGLDLKIVGGTPPYTILGFNASCLADPHRTIEPDLIRATHGWLTSQCRLSYNTDNTGAITVNVLKGGDGYTGPTFTVNCTDAGTGTFVITCTVASGSVVSATAGSISGTITHNQTGILVYNPVGTVPNGSSISSYNTGFNSISHGSNLADFLGQVDGFGPNTTTITNTTAVLHYSTNGASAITVTIINGGTGYLGDFKVTVTDAGTGTFVVTATVVNGVVTATAVSSITGTITPSQSNINITGGVGTIPVPPNGFKISNYINVDINTFDSAPFNNISGPITNSWYWISLYYKGLISLVVKDAKNNYAYLNKSVLYDMARFSWTGYAFNSGQQIDSTIGNYVYGSGAALTYNGKPDIVNQNWGMKVIGYMERNNPLNEGNWDCTQSSQYLGIFNSDSTKTFDIPLSFYNGEMSFAPLYGYYASQTYSLSNATNAGQALVYKFGIANPGSGPTAPGGFDAFNVSTGSLVTTLNAVNTTNTSWVQLQELRGGYTNDYPNIVLKQNYAGQTVQPLVHNASYRLTPYNGSTGDVIVLTVKQYYDTRLSSLTSVNSTPIVIKLYPTGFTSDTVNAWHTNLAFGQGGSAPTYVTPVNTEILQTFNLDPPLGPPNLRLEVTFPSGFFAITRVGQLFVNVALSIEQPINDPSNPSPAFYNAEGRGYMIPFVIEFNNS